MAQLAFIVDCPDYPAAFFGGVDFLSVGIETTRLVRMQVPVPDNVALSAVAIDTTVVLDPAVTTDIVAGDSAGDITVTGITTADTLLSVQSVDDSDQTVADLTSEFSITATDTINNTGGTDTSGTHLVVTYRT